MTQLEFAHSHVDGVLVLTAVGDVDLATASTLREYLLGHLATKPAAIVLRLDPVPFLDSSGLSALVAAHHQAAQQQTTLSLAAPSDPVTKVLQLTSIDKIIPTYGSLRAAIDAAHHHDTDTTSDDGIGSGALGN